MEDPEDRPIFDPGDIVESPNGDFCVKIIKHVGEGRCCLVYSAKVIRDGSKVALKVFKKGPTYDGAVQREQYILDAFNHPKHNIGKDHLTEMDLVCFFDAHFEGHSNLKIKLFRLKFDLFRLKLDSLY